MKQHPCLPVLSWFSCAVMLVSSPARCQTAGTAPAGGAFFNVRDCGATGDSKTLDSPAINKAIDACAAGGGGAVLAPAGTYLSGSIRFKSNIRLLIDAGATTLGAPRNMNAYDETEQK